MSLFNASRKGLLTDPPKLSTPATAPVVNDSIPAVTPPSYKWENGSVLKQMKNGSYVPQTSTQVYNMLLDRDDLYLPEVSGGKTRAQTRNFVKTGMNQALQEGNLDMFRSFLNPASAGAGNAIAGVTPLDVKSNTGESLFKNRQTSRAGRLIN